MLEPAGTFCAAGIVPFARLGRKVTVLTHLAYRTIELLEGINGTLEV